jgi:predicted outer membrane protein
MPRLLAAGVALGLLFALTWGVEQDTADKTVPVAGPPHAAAPRVAATARTAKVEAARTFKITTRAFPSALPDTPPKKPCAET